MKRIMTPDKHRPGLALFFIGVLLATPVSAQDHTGHGDPVDPGASGDVGVDDVHSGNMPTTIMDTPVSTVMDHDMSMPEQSEVRDPHAYSNGYSRTSGPYVLPESQQLHLADETMFIGLWVDRFETRHGDAEDYQEFTGHVWLGNSYQRLILRSEWEWRDQTYEESKTEFLYTRAISPFWNAQFGVRYDHGDRAHRDWLALGVNGIAPYWFEISANAYLGPGGHSAATVEIEYDLLLTQRLILQPKLGLDFYGDSDLDAGHSQGLSKSKAGFRLRYEINRQFAPYIGYERVHHHGDAVAVFEPVGQHRESQWIAGFRFWF